MRIAVFALLCAPAACAGELAFSSFGPNNAYVTNSYYQMQSGAGEPIRLGWSFVAQTGGPIETITAAAFTLSPLMAAPKVEIWDEFEGVPDTRLGLWEFPNVQPHSSGPPAPSISVAPTVVLDAGSRYFFFVYREGAGSIIYHWNVGFTNLQQTQWSQRVNNGPWEAFNHPLALTAAFSITVVPEPALAALLPAAAVMLRRRRSA